MRLFPFLESPAPHGITRCRELIAVAVAQIDRDPVVRDRLVDPALKIAVAYLEKIIALKYAARRYPVDTGGYTNYRRDFPMHCGASFPSLNFRAQIVIYDTQNRRNVYVGVSHPGDPRMAALLHE